MTFHVSVIHRNTACMLCCLFFKLCQANDVATVVYQVDFFSSHFLKVNNSPPPSKASLSNLHELILKNATCQRETFWKACRALDKVLSENIASHSASILHCACGAKCCQTRRHQTSVEGVSDARQIQYHPVFGMLHSIFFPFIFLHSKRYIVCIHNSSEENILLKSNLKGVENLIIPFM